MTWCWTEAPQEEKEEEVEEGEEEAPPRSSPVLQKLSGEHGLLGRLKGLQEGSGQSPPETSRRSC